MTKASQFKNQFPEFCGVVNFFTDDCEQVNWIDVESDLVEFTTSVTASCGCCSDIESHSASLDEFFEFMSDEDFEMLVKQLK
jgi:hypothetical protein